MKSLPSRQILPSTRIVALRALGLIIITTIIIITVNFVTIQGHLCDANLWFGGFPYPVNPGRPEWSKVQTRGKPLVATAQAKYMSAGEQ